MIGPRELYALKAQLFQWERATVFAILDGASMPELPAVIDSFDLDYKCLYRGVLQPDMAQVAPYLVALDREAPFTDWVLSNGWGMNWGIFGVSSVDIQVLNRHLRRFVKVEVGGKNVYFRYYDPTVMRNYLPTCTSDELRTVFGPVVFFFLEDENAQIARMFLFGENTLQQEALSLNEMDTGIAADAVAASFAERETSACGDILTMRPEQVKHLGQSIYVGRMRGYLHEVFPESKQVPREVLGQIIVELTERAAGYKLVLETHVAPFLAAAWIFGMDFDEDFRAAKEVLEDYDMDCGRKAQWLWDFIDATAGEVEDEQQKV